MIPHGDTECQIAMLRHLEAQAEAARRRRADHLRGGGHALAVHIARLRNRIDALVDAPRLRNRVDDLARQARWRGYRSGGGTMRWVTRARPKVDRIACPWLIRRFVDPDAQFL